MPRPVVPILFAPFASSRARSICAVRRQDQRRILGELQIGRRDVDALLPDRIDLLEQRPGIDDDAVADDRDFLRPHDARGQQAELELDAVDDERMTGVMAALEAHDDIGALRQPVDDLAFALIAPLGADHRDIRHDRLPYRHSRESGSTAPCRFAVPPLSRG